MPLAAAAGPAGGPRPRLVAGARPPRHRRPRAVVAVAVVGRRRRRPPSRARGYAARTATRPAADGVATDPPPSRTGNLT